MSNKNMNNFGNSQNDFFLFNNNKEEENNSSRQNNQQLKEGIQDIKKEFNIENECNPKTVIIKKNKNNTELYHSIKLDNKNNKNKKIDPIEAERKKKENEEKNKIRNKLQCFICFGKIRNAVMCPKCKGIACEDCVKKILSKYNTCSNCRQRVLLKDMIKLPFMNDLTNFFINNVERKKINEKDEIENNINNNNGNSGFKTNLKVEACKYHPNKNTEYICFNCNDYLCPDCLVFFNKENVEKHTNHIILSNEEINEYNLKNIIDEYKILKDKYNKLDSDVINYKINIKEIEIYKKRINDIIDSIKEQIKIKFQKKENEIKYIMNILKSKNNDIENSIKTFKKEIEKRKENNNIEKNKAFLNNLKKLNYIPYNKKEIEEKCILQKNIFCETYESNLIEFKIPNGTYSEGLELFNEELKIIPNMKCKLNSLLLSNSIHFTLTIQINDELYKKIQPTFYGHFIIFNKTNCEYSIFNNYYNKGEEILSVTFEFSKMKALLDENNKCKLKFFITENYYK